MSTDVTGLTLRRILQHQLLKPIHTINVANARIGTSEECHAVDVATIGKDGDVFYGETLSA